MTFKSCITPKRNVKVLNLDELFAGMIAGFFSGWNPYAFCWIPMMLIERLSWTLEALIFVVELYSFLFVMLSTSYSINNKGNARAINKLFLKAIAFAFLFCTRGICQAIGHHSLGSRDGIFLEWHWTFLCLICLLWHLLRANFLFWINFSVRKRMRTKIIHVTQKTKKRKCKITLDT